MFSIYFSPSCLAVAQPLSGLPTALALLRLRRQLSAAFSASGRWLFDLNFDVTFPPCMETDGGDPNATAAWLAHVAAAGRPRPPQISRAMHCSGWREQPSNVEQVLDDFRDKMFTIAEVDLDLTTTWNNPNMLILRMLIVMLETGGSQGYLGHLTLTYGELDAAYAQAWVEVLQRGLQSRTTYREILPHLSRKFLNKTFSSFGWRPKRSFTGNKVVCDVPWSGKSDSHHKFFEYVVSEFMADLRLEVCEGQYVPGEYVPPQARPVSGRAPAGTRPCRWWCICSWCAQVVFAKRSPST